MGLKQNLQDDMKQALKSGNKSELSTLRMLLAEIKNAEIEKREELSEEGVIQVIARQAKKWEQAALEYEKVGQSERAEKEKGEAETLKKYLPAQMSEEEIEKLVDETITEVEASSITDMGKVMGAIMPKVRGRADGSLVNELVKKKLQEV